MSGLIVLVLLVVGYFLPTFIAGIRKPPHANSVAVVNLLLGWTFIGWVAALAMSLRDVNPTLRR